MNTNLLDEFTKALFPLVWIFPTIALVLTYLRRRDRERLKLEVEMREMEREFRNFSAHRDSRDLEQSERYRPKLVQELLARLERHDLEFARLAAMVSAQRTASEDSLSTDNNSRVVREISHALNTPLSQIEAAAASISSGSLSAEDTKDSLASISESLGICKSFLGAYRELGEISSSSAVWSPNSLRSALDSAGHVYGTRLNRAAPLEIDVPDAIPGYSNNYITALLLPVLENAIEAKTAHSKVVISHSQDDTSNVFTVANESTEPPRGNEIYQPGFTTKSAHDGTGLSAIQNLLSVYRGASISHAYDAPITTFRITLPKRVL